ncbi:PREDICTED: septin-9-like [Cyprinodon variegatus]|uniref:septin-9-like n=1 Tax=Cyprinodon variegatus TaxID=28743 RepID=UPI000742B407|nr:PREDICTED: septin-9-like [Cyprinodon variegatus]
MSDGGVNPHLEGIISDFEALKRSFEVEDVDTSSHSSPGSRRATNSPLRNAMSPTSIYYRDLGSTAPSTNNNNLNYSQPRSIMGGGGSRTPEPVSRRSELSIDISSSSKQVDNVTSPASTRFVSNSVLKRPEVLGHSRTPDMSHKREVTFAKTLTDSPGTRRNEGNNNNGIIRAPEQNHSRKFESASLSDPRKPEINITKAPPENNGHHPAVHHPHHPNPHHNTIVTTFRCSSPSHAGRKSPNPDRSEVSLSHSNMSESAKPHHPIPPGKGEKSHAGDFSYVGIDAILEQMRRKAMKQGFELNLMVVGQSGLGKSTLMNTLFKSKVSRNKSVQSGPEERIPKTVEIKSISHESCSLRPLDVEFMRRLSKVVNIVPVIAKADTLTLEERESFKETIREELRANGIDVYPQKEFDEDAEDRMINDKIREMIPFAVVGSDQEYQVNGKRLLGRKTKWGTIEVENIAHCEFAYLRDLLIRTHMQNIKDITGSIHYETYRVRRLNESNGHVVSEPSDHAPVQPKAQLEEQPGPPQTNGLAAQHEALSHEM